MFDPIEGRVDFSESFDRSLTEIYD
jgi:hypothetical protein